MSGVTECAIVDIYDYIDKVRVKWNHDLIFSSFLTCKLHDCSTVKENLC